MPQVVIVGGGVSGLSLAYRLLQAAPRAQVTVLEEASRPGGVVGTLHADNFLVETGPNGFLESNPATLNLARELGIGDGLVRAEETAARNRYIFFGDRLRRLPGGPCEFLGSDLLSWRGKLRLLAERFVRRGKSEDESVDAFAQRRAGKEAARVFADALVTGIHAGDPELLSLPAAFPRLAEWERRHGSILKAAAATARERRRNAAARGETVPTGNRLWSFRAGLGSLPEALARRLARPPAFGVTVRRLTRGASARPPWAVYGHGTDCWAADAVVLACPAYRQAEILEDLDLELAHVVGGIAYNAVAVVALGYRRADIPGDLDGFGYIAPQRLRRDVLGVQFCSSIFPGRAPAGFALLRAMCGGWHRADVVEWDEGRLVSAVREDLAAALGVRTAPCCHRVIRWPRAIPQYHVGHLTRVAEIQVRAQAHPGLFLAGNAYYGVALNDCTTQAGLVAQRIAEFLNASDRSSS